MVPGKRTIDSFREIRDHQALKDLQEEQMALDFDEGSNESPHGRKSKRKDPFRDWHAFSVVHT